MHTDGQHRCNDCYEKEIKGTTAVNKLEHNIDFDNDQGNQLAKIFARMQEYYECPGQETCERIFTMMGNIVAESSYRMEDATKYDIGGVCMGAFIKSYMKQVEKITGERK